MFVNSIIHQVNFFQESARGGSRQGMRRNMEKKWSRDGPGLWGIYEEFIRNLSGTRAPEKPHKFPMFAWKGKGKCGGEMERTGKLRMPQKKWKRECVVK